MSLWVKQTQLIAATLAAFLLLLLEFFLYYLELRRIDMGLEINEIYFALSMLFVLGFLLIHFTLLYDNHKDSNPHRD
jgi:ABC-type multidrug transport system fused ATPase/permease subunit